MGVAVGPNNEVLVAGDFEGTVTFGQVQKTALGTRNVFLWRLLKL